MHAQRVLEFLPLKHQLAWDKKIFKHIRYRKTQPLNEMQLQIYTKVLHTDMKTLRLQDNNNDMIKKQKPTAKNKHTLHRILTFPIVLFSIDSPEAIRLYEACLEAYETHTYYFSEIHLQANDERIPRSV